ncbi:hypothetical protein ACFFGE_04360 [Brevundimonas balnearis]|uniref:Lipoprotein n=1 Tax=Brevundimonas balnearis TaxID=1572858 RepID=A0ABV6R0G8_9CAUL
MRLSSTWASRWLSAWATSVLCSASTSSLIAPVSGRTAHDRRRS